MTLDMLLGGFAALLLLGYMTAAILWPEKF